MLKLIAAQRLPARSIIRNYRKIPNLHFQQPPASQTRAMSSLMQQQRRPAGGGLLSLMRALDDYDGPISSQLTGFSPRFDFRETKDGYQLAGELPGVEKKDIEIDFPDASTLNVRGHTEQESSEEGAEGAWWCAERSTGDFRRSFSFPRPVDRDHVEATLKNGVLSINIPKAEEFSTGKRIDIR
ncbi:HSP20-like chaperone [Aspergillus heterothallicus]